VAGFPPGHLAWWNVDRQDLGLGPRSAGLPLHLVVLLFYKRFFIWKIGTQGAAVLGSSHLAHPPPGPT
jgi:hypothetical protein